jgi:CubicO group peptidase (beta-lactamase class C family)
VVVALGVALAACAPPVAPRATAGDPRWAALDQAVPGLLAEHGVASVSIARVEHGELVWAAAYGWQTEGVRATPATLYNIASLSKPLSSEAILRLAARGQVTLDEPMSPWWVDPDIAGDPRHAQLTLRLALSHRTGFANWRRMTGGVLQFTRPPGTAFGYSGEGFEYAARFVERKTGELFETVAQTLVLDPAGMTSTSYTFRPWFVGRVAVPHDADGKPLAPSFARRWTASDLVYSTPSDYARFLISVARGDGLTPALVAERARVQVSRKAEMCPPPAPGCPRDVGIGLSWEVDRFGEDVVLMHTGQDDGLFAFAYLDLTRRSGTVIFTNSAHGGDIVLPILERIGADPVFVAFLRSQS